MGLIIDSFAGGGGASTGIEIALGRSPDIAINHDAEAIAMHMANHPQTKHYIEDIWQVDPVKVCQGQDVDFMWLSPDCTHFSKAKGGAPKSNKIRGLAWIAIRWAKAVRPKVIILENVEEFKTWGPLDSAGQPVKSQQGQIFGLFIESLRKQGYSIDYRELRACDYGAPTIRKRFFLVARCDDKFSVWPKKTHSIGTYRTAADCLDWHIPVPSIFSRKKPLVDATLRKIAKGTIKFVVNNPRPYIRAVDWWKESNHEITVSAFLAQYHGEQSGREVRGQKLDEPIMVVDSSNRYGFVACTLSTIMSGCCGKTGLIAAFLAKYYGNEKDGCSLTEPLHTVTSKDRMGLVAATLSGYPLVITDIGMRMLQPRELFRAQGFPEGYVIDPIYNGRPLSKKAQVRMAGNSVCPPIAAVLVKANYPALLCAEATSC